MNKPLSVTPHSTILDPKLPVTPSGTKGFSLLECLIAMAILALLAGAVLPHQVLLVRKQEQIILSWESKRQTHHAALVAAYSQP